jgi:AcrR family transcriptional regulator
VVAKTQIPNAERRSGRSHQAVLHATVELCREVGYGALTIDGIATRAGVGKQTIYRWWPSKGAVVLDAFMNTIATHIAFPETGDSLQDIRIWLRSVARLMASPQMGPHLAGLIGAKQSDPALAQAFDQQVHQPIRTLLNERIQRAQHTGQLRSQDPEVIADLIVGPLWFRLLISGKPADPDYLDSALDALLAGLTPYSPPGPALQDRTDRPAPIAYETLHPTPRVA